MRRIFGRFAHSGGSVPVNPLLSSLMSFRCVIYVGKSLIRCEHIMYYGGQGFAACVCVCVYEEKGVCAPVSPVGIRMCFHVSAAHQS